MSLNPEILELIHADIDGVATASEQVRLRDIISRNSEAREEYRRLRETAPVHWNPERPPGRGFWVLTRYDDIVSVSNRPDLYCNGQGYKSVDDTYLRISDHAGAAMRRILPAIDPPEHTA